MAARRRKGFTLIELLVVIAIIALLISIVLPSLGEARRAAQNTVSLANLKSLSGMCIAYGNEYKESVVNPFDPNPQGINYYDVRVPHNPAFVWQFNDGIPTVMFSFHWASLMMAWNNPVDMGNKVQFAPGDLSVVNRFRQFQTSGLAIEDYIWDGSYVYSPTFWFNSTRYATSPPTPISQATIRRNTYADITSPSAKVMLFERFDFSQQYRNESGTSTNRAKKPPQWNNAGSNTRFAVADGSVDSVRMRDLYSLTNATTNPNVEARTELTPVGNFNISNTVLGNYDMANDGFENGAAGTGGPYPSYFFGTRNGIRGRDLNR